MRDGLPLRKFQHVTFGDEVETPYGVGLGRELYWPWWFKKNGIKFWMMFCDKFASPTVVGEYEGGNATSPEDQNKLLSAAQAVHSNNAIIHPKGMNLSLLEAARSGNISTYRELAEFMNDEMTICILGQTATTTGKPGSMGDANEQADVREDIIKADADALCEALNSGVVSWLVDYQFPGRKNKRAYGVPFEFDQYLALAERMKTLQGKALLTINDHPDIRDVFSGFRIKSVDINYTVGGAGKGKARKELLITNN